MENNIIKWSAMISSWSMSNGKVAKVESPFSHLHTLTSLSLSHTLSIFFPCQEGDLKLTNVQKFNTYWRSVLCASVIKYLSEHSSFGSISSAPRN